MKLIVSAVLTGQVDPDFSPREGSAISKVPVAGPVAISPMGLAGDSQADRINHGGLDKALHHYPAEHYSFWRSQLGDHPLLNGPGGFGENLYLEGLDERTACLGDRFRLGTALVEISHGRQPCWKLAHRFGVPGMVVFVLSSGRTGWYYRVIEPGIVQAGDHLELLDRPLTKWTIKRLTSAILGGSGTPEDYTSLAGMPVLAEAWRSRAQALSA